MPTFREIVFREIATGAERLYFVSADQPGGLEGLIYRSRPLLRDDPRGGGTPDEAWEFAGIHKPGDYTPACTSPVVQPPALTVLPGGRRKAPVAW